MQQKKELNHGTDRLEELEKLFQLFRQYQKDWQELGVDRVYKYFDNVEGDWLDDF